MNRDHVICLSELGIIFVISWNGNFGLQSSVSFVLVCFNKYICLTYLLFGNNF